MTKGRVNADIIADFEICVDHLSEIENLGARIVRAVKTK